jgi:hypothetical protein
MTQAAWMLDFKRDERGNPANEIIVGLDKGFFRRGNLLLVEENAEASRYLLSVERASDGKLFQYDMDIFEADKLATRSRESVRTLVVSKMFNLFGRIEDMSEANESSAGPYPVSTSEITAERSLPIKPVVDEVFAYFAAEYGMEIA